MPPDVRIVVAFLVGAALLAAGVIGHYEPASALGALVMAGAFAVPLVGIGRERA